MRPHVLLLPGNMCDERLWQGGDDIIARTIKGFDVEHHYVDFQDDASIASMAQRALNSQTGPLIPIGFSMGGIVALEMARIAPQRLLGLGLIDTTSAADRRSDERSAQQINVRAGQLERVIIDEMKPNYLAPCFRNDTKLLDLLKDMAVKLGPDVFVRQSEALRLRPDLTNVLSTINMPTIVACGGEDSLCTPKTHQDMAARIPSAQFISVPNAGHVMPLEQPAALASIIANLLSTIIGHTHD